MFECKKPAEISSFVGEEMRQLADVAGYPSSYGQPLTTADEHSPFLLFGVEFFYLDEELLQNFVTMARERIGKLLVEDFRRDWGDAECNRQRYEVNRMFRIVLGQLSAFKDDELLRNICVVNDCVPDLVDVAEDTGVCFGKKMSSLNYEYFHAVLDWRWHGLLINFLLHKTGPTKVKFETMYHGLLECLVRLALLKYNKMMKNYLVEESHFYCPCVRKVWIGVMAMSTDKQYNIDFWDGLQKAMQRVELTGESGNVRPRKYNVRTASRATESMFKIWLINGVVSLYQYRLLDEATFKETPLITIPADYTILENAIKDIAQGTASEEQIRIILLLLKPIYTVWWPTKQDYIILLWEYFNKRLHLPFQLPSEPLSNLARVARSPSALIEQARDLARQQTFEALDTQTSSFNSYIALVAFTLRHYSSTKQKTKVQILFNRTILKLAPPKLETMTEQAIYNFTLLMLIMVESTPYQDDYLRLSKQLLQFKIDPLQSPTATDGVIRRLVTITLANMAMTVALSEKGFDRSAHLQCFIGELEKMSRRYGERIQPALHTTAECMSTVYEGAFGRGGRFDKGEHSFLGSWLEKYLKGCSEDERDALFKTMCNIFDCFKRNQGFHPAEHEKILQPLYEIVLPVVKKCFNADTSASLVVAELAVNFTLFASGQPYAPLFLPLFTFFVDSSTAHVKLRLHFIQLVTASSRAGEIDNKLIIRNWLKFALINGRDQLRELSRVVCGISEFQALCDIPEWDLCDSEEEPIEQFFKFVGRKYKALEGKDGRAQYEMTMKMHALFQQFDKWVTSPNINLLRRITMILALAIKECGELIYIRSNPSCLYHFAFSQYFLPFSVLTNRNVPNDIIFVMGKVWNRVMDAIGHMNYSGDPAIGDHVTNMMVKWTPQFVKFIDKTDTLKPFVTFFSSQNEAMVAFAFGKFTQSHLDLQGSIPKENAECGLKVLAYLLDTLKSSQDNGKIALFIRLLGSGILKHAIATQECYPSKAHAADLVMRMVACTRNDSNLIKMEMKNALAAFTKRYLPMETANFFRIMCKLADQDPRFIRSTMSTVRVELEQTEQLRGGGQDKHLRRMLKQLDDAVEVGMQKRKMMEL